MNIIEFTVGLNLSCYSIRHNVQNLGHKKKKLKFFVKLEKIVGKLF